MLNMAHPLPSSPLTSLLLHTTAICHYLGYIISCCWIDFWGQEDFQIGRNGLKCSTRAIGLESPSSRPGSTSSSLLQPSAVRASSRSFMPFRSGTCSLCLQPFILLLLRPTRESMMSSSITQTQGSGSAPGSGITGGYSGDSLAMKAVIAVFAALSIYNALELIALIFLTFTHYKGVYFWSLLIASWGIHPYTMGFLLKFFEITTTWDKYISLSMLTVGWYAMVTGQSVVLWSRLHLLVTGPGGARTLRWTKYMIIINAIILHVPTTVLTFGSNGNIGTATFVRGFDVYEKVQMVGFWYGPLKSVPTVPITLRDV